MSQPIKLFLVTLTLVAISIFGYTYHFQQKNKRNLSKNSKRVLFEHKEESGDSKLQEVEDRMQQEFEKIRNPSTLTIPDGALLKAKNDTEKLLKSLSSRRNIGVADLDWQNRGPSNVAGRTRAVLFDLNDATNNTVFAGGVAGGLWKSTNFQSGAPNWIPIDDFFDNIAISAIIQDHNNPAIMYFGTGEGWNNFDAVRGLGVWKSTDGGNTWAKLASTNPGRFRFIQDLLIDNHGNLYASTRARGVQRSTDGGTSFEQVIGSQIGLGPNNLATDLELGPEGDIYAALGIQQEGAVFHSSGNLGANTGAAGTWTDITPTGSFRRIELATAASQTGRVYAVCQGKVSLDVTNISRTDNHGTSWTSVTVPTICNQGTTTIFTREQAWFDLIAGVDPTNANRIYVGGIDALRSDDGGSTWIPITTWAPTFNCDGVLPTQFVHADHHALVFEPGASNKIVLGTDGGLFHTLDGTVANPTFISKNKNYNVTQFNGLAIHPDIASSYFLAGAQDNGTQRFNAPGYSSTVGVTGGDGGIPHIDQDNPNIQITAFLFNGYFISIDGGNTFERGARASSGRAINPSDYDNAANKLYAAAGTNEYFRWEDPATEGDTYSTLTVSELGGKVSAVFTSPNVANRVYFGTGAGTIVSVDDADSGADGTSKTGTLLLDLTEGYISSIDVQTGDENHLLATLSNYGVESVFESTDGGSNWTNIEGNLPNMPVRWGIFNPSDPNEVLLATELGVWSTTDLDGAATVWMPTNANLANVRMDMLQYRASDDIIVAASHGRGLYVAGGAVPSCTDGVRNGTELGVDCGCDCPDSCGILAVAETIQTAIEITISGSYMTDGASTGNGCYGCEESTHADWYSFTAPENGSIDLSSCGGDSESRLYIHEGVCGFLNTIASDDEACMISATTPYAAEILGIPVECGNTYYFEWDNRWDENAFAFTFDFIADGSGSPCDSTVTNVTIINSAGQLKVYPNPINHQTAIDYELVNTTPLSLSIYNTNGQLVKVLMDKVVQEPGQYTIPLNASDLPAGIYYLNLESDSGQLTEKLMVVK